MFTVSDPTDPPRSHRVAQFSDLGDLKRNLHETDFVDVYVPDPMGDDDRLHETDSGFKTPRSRKSIDRLRNASATRQSMQIYDSGDIDLVMHTEKREARAISVWVGVCSHNADLHKNKARVLRTIHFALVLLTLISSTTASVLAGFSAKSAPSSTIESYTALIASAMSTAFMAIMAFVDPASRRNRHLLAEVQYAILGRDMSVYLSGLSDKSDRGRDMDIRTAIQEYQRRMDNLDAVAPVV